MASRACSLGFWRGIDRSFANGVALESSAAFGLVEFNLRAVDSTVPSELIGFYT